MLAISGDGSVHFNNTAARLCYVDNLNIVRSI